MKKQPDTLEPVALNRRQAAKRLNVCLRTVATWMKTGKLPYVKLSPHCVRILNSDINRLYESHRIGGK